MDIDFHEDGAPAWVELRTPDAEKSKRFYGQLFGWTFADGFGSQPHSQMAELGGRPAAAVTATPGTQRGSWTTFINVTDLAKTVEKIAATGGRVVKGPRSLGTAGRSAVVADHAGTPFGLWEGDEHHGFGVSGEPGAFHGGELITDDTGASSAFYRQVFGWTLGEPYGPLNRRDWQLGGRMVAVLLPRPPAMPSELPPYWDVYFTVADAAQTTDAAVRLGATMLMPATATEHGVIAVLSDSVGALLTVLAPSH
ncbi:VOC family protein [Streptomyces sp. NBC_01497]|uniref:VOC family protein n=1 Tax=Streptomyces sp. NBC_01497 TaxID=2903885 RepID=UPI002E2F2F33|nr:VOC family protein [Streptomyces sp. NBC_01497]